MLAKKHNLTNKALQGDTLRYHMSKPVDVWVCIDWNTGKTLWTSKWYSKGSVISADGMRYLYEERSVMLLWQSQILQQLLL